MYWENYNVEKNIEPFLKKVECKTANNLRYLCLENDFKIT